MANQKLNEQAKGIYPIAATPFTDNGALDLESSDSLVDYYLEAGAHGISFLIIEADTPGYS